MIDKDALNAATEAANAQMRDASARFKPIDRIEFTDTIGQAIDALNAGVAMVNAASERMKALGLSPQISVNGHDYGDKVSVYIQGEVRSDDRRFKPIDTPLMEHLAKAMQGK